MHCFKRFIKISLILMLTVGVMFSCCSCGVQSSASTIATTVANTLLFHDESVIIGDYSYSADSNDVLLAKALSTKDVYVNYDVVKAYSQYLDSTYSAAVITRAEWLTQLFRELDFEIISDMSSEYTHVSDLYYSDYSDYFITAIENIIIGPNSTMFDPYCAVTRQYVSTSLVNAVGYPRTYKLSCRDYKKIEDKSQAAAAVHLGYFELDENNCFDPYGLVTDEQVEYIVSELEKLSVLKGKTVMTFGDSIMHGDGNNFVGIADMLSQRYLMTAVDYSYGGSAFGKIDNREQICTQISRAINKNETADIILLNGGTNDMRKIAAGEISDDFNYEDYGTSDFASGMEYAVGLIKDNYPQVPLLYIRAHNMECSLERNELHFGKLALDICEKWEVEVADVFNDTDFNSHDEDMKCSYTVHTKSCRNGDSIHPNQLGYYKFYLPLVSENAVRLISSNQ